MKLIIASGNQGKLREIRAILGEKFDEILSMKEAGIDHETVEDGSTFLENAQKKAREIAELSGCAALADDSGICVNALGGEPGIYSARYCGRHGDDEANNRLLIENLKEWKIVARITPAPSPFHSPTAVKSTPKASFSEKSLTSREGTVASVTTLISIWKNSARRRQKSPRKRKIRSATAPKLYSPFWSNYKIKKRHLRVSFFLDER